MLSQEVERTIERALKAAEERRHEFATVEHLCLALLENHHIRGLLSQLGVSKKELHERFLEFLDNNMEVLPIDSEAQTLPSLGFQRVLERAAIHIAGAGKDEVLVEHVLVAAFDEDDSYAVYIMKQAGITRLDLVSVISHGGELEDQEDADEEELEASPSKKSALSRYAVCLTDEAKKNKIDEVIGREQEIARMIQILTRRRKNNPLLVGEPGVGKTALAEGLANKIAAGQVPEHLRDSELFLLDMGSMLAGARYRGDFENRMKAVFAALEKKPNAIMVIDEIHTIVGAGATAGSSMDASNMLKPILSKGNLRCIGSTTHKEYRTYFEKDRALARRFQKIDIEEPSDEESFKILLGIKKRYEDFHGVMISDEALKLSVSLSKRYLHERKLPDKAIDLIDEACARLRLLNKKDQENQGDLLVPRVDENAILEAVASMAHIPSQKISQDDKDLLSHLEQTLKENVFGQDQAIETVTNAILLSRAGLRDQEKPIGCFLFTGPSGVGKTEVAKQIARALGNNLVRFDMSEYMERHAASRLVGAPPGYVGYEQGGLLTDAIHKTPYAVLLLDEIEKAHSDVFNMLLQVMDYGKLTDSNGRTTDFRHVILIMTSNAGARELEQRSIGFMGGEQHRASDRVIKNIFAPEFRNRLDARISFNKLSQDIMIEVVHKFINELKEQLLEKHVEIEISKDALKFLAEGGYDATMGARPLARMIQEKIKKPLAHELLFGELAQGGKVLIKVEDSELVIDSKPVKQKSALKQ